MSMYDSTDLASAEFARHPDGRVAARNGSGRRWYAKMPAGFWANPENNLMAADGWAPVLECPDPEQHEVASVALEHPAMEGVGESPLPLFEAVNSLLNELAKAERERDGARADAESLSRQLHDAQQDADMSRAELEGEPRPLTPDAITDETRDRAYRAVAALSVCDWDDMSGVAKGRAMAVVEAVITEITRPEPPKRPEGAEEIEAYMRELVASHPEDHYGELADHLASRGVLPPLTDKTNPERGARVTGGEDR